MASINGLQQGVNLTQVNFPTSISGSNGYLYLFPAGESQGAVRNNQGEVTSFVERVSAVAARRELVGNALFGVPDMRTSFDTAAFFDTRFILGVDFSPNVCAFWEKVAQLMIASPNRVEFIFQLDMLFNEFSSSFDDRNRVQVKQQIGEGLRDNSCWLASNQGYERVRTIVLAGNFKMSLLNLFDHETVAAYIETAQRAGVVFREIHLSNISQYVSSPEEFESYRKSVVLLKEAFPSAIVTYTNRNGLLEIAPLAAYDPKYSLHGLKKVIDQATWLELSQHGIDLEEQMNSFTPLYTCDSSEPVMRFLIGLGSNIEAQNRSGFTPLAYAATKNDLTKARVLIESRASVDTPDHNGWYPIHLAATYSSLPVLDCLLEHRPEFVYQRVGREGGLLPLHVAKGGAVAESLLRAKAPIDQPDGGGFTALHWAVSRRDTSKVAALVTARADVTLKNHQGMTAQELASPDDLEMQVALQKEKGMPPS